MSEYCAGMPWMITVERDARGKLLISSGLDPRSAAGGDVALTLDATLQAEIDASLEEVVATTGARRGAVVSMDPRSGDILALSEVPSFVWSLHVNQNHVIISQRLKCIVSFSFIVCVVKPSGAWNVDDFHSSVYSYAFDYINS